ncbi:MAG TPA: nuclear transport factor 2 family protein [Candidatus Binataceae bacterium]|jgi:ketosteroid isomerase-like protein
MSVKEIESAVQELANAFNKMDIKAVVNLLSENLEVFDHVPYRFDNKKQFADFLAPAFAPLASANFGFRQLSCRMINDGAAVANAYDTFTGMTKDGKPMSVHGRTTLVFGKEAGQWKVVSAHFSPLPKES